MTQLDFSKVLAVCLIGINVMEIQFSCTNWRAHFLYIHIHIYIYIYTKRIAMCPPGYHHNGFMATPELGHRMYGYMYSTEIVFHIQCHSFDFPVKILRLTVELL